MCGIVGYVGFGDDQVVDGGIENRVRSVLELMKLRGPDGNGIVKEEQWILGHTRLAIIDPLAGQQPMQDPESKVTITYNGEIYNFRELRRLLQGKGYTFRTDCDTELVLKAYLEWEEACVEKFNGFFSFGIIDPVKQVLFCARDRIGIKPFYYVNNQKYFCFCSQIPGILTLCEGTFQVNFEALSHYLTSSRTALGEQTLLNDVKMLLPGHRMRIDLQNAAVSVERYWKRPVVSEKDKADISFQDAVEKSGELLQDSVRKRLMSDVPLGAFLSGGLDSAITSTTAAEYADFDLPLFCAGTQNEQEDEFNYAELVAKQIGVPLNQVAVTVDRFAKNWRFLIRQKGLPLSTPNEVSIYCLAAELQKKCKVTLTGEGADEIFGGYVQPQFSTFDYERCSHDPESAETESAFAFSMVMSYGRSFFINDTDHYLATGCWLTFVDKAALFKPEIWQSIDEDEAVFAFYEDFFEKLDGCSTFDKRMHLHAEFNLENLLSRVDNCTMAASVEARVPFTDHRIAEFAFSLPDSFKMNWKDAEAEELGRDLSVKEIDRRELLVTKRLPRAFYADRLPQAVIDRKKMSFPVPFKQWLAGPLMQSVFELCLNSSLTKAIFQEKALAQLLAMKNRNLWLLANLCNWWEDMAEQFPGKIRL